MAEVVDVLLRARMEASGVALATGDMKNSKALEIYFLDEDIDRDSEWR